MGFYTDRGDSVADAKNACGLEIESWYGGATLDVFDCNVVGTMYRYYCSEADQLRFINGKVSNLPIALMCGPVPAQADQDPVYAWKQHTAVECGKVHNAYLEFTKATSAEYRNFLTQLAAATTVAEVDVIFAALWGTAP